MPKTPCSLDGCNDRVLFAELQLCRRHGIEVGALTAADDKDDAFWDAQTDVVQTDTDPAVIPAESEPDTTITTLSEGESNVQ